MTGALRRVGVELEEVQPGAGKRCVEAGERPVDDRSGVELDHIPDPFHEGAEVQPVQPLVGEDGVADLGRGRVHEPRGPRLTC